MEIDQLKYLCQNDLKGPILDPISDLHFSSQTAVEQPHLINYPKKL